MNDTGACCGNSPHDHGGREGPAAGKRRPGCGHATSCPAPPRADTAPPHHGLTRRAVVAGSLGLAAGLAGCLGSDSGGEAPEPVDLGQSDQCEVCGMVIPNHPGPSAEIFYADEQPSGHENPARFCSTWEAFQYDFERQDRGWARRAFYVTDYSAVEYELTTDGGDVLISTHPGAGAFLDATDVTFVVGSEVKGSMGRDLIGFSAAGDAEEFQSEHGGDLLAFDEVTRDAIAQLASS